MGDEAVAPAGAVNCMFIGWLWCEKAELDVEEDECMGSGRTGGVDDEEGPLSNASATLSAGRLAHGISQREGKQTHSSLWVVESSLYPTRSEACLVPLRHGCPLGGARIRAGP